ncbi:MAG: TonB-dependent receptor [Gammaproteobacteria bacterium]|nr:TonB-dependent receptor [Gammaproteobacteria bacterium]
MGRRIVLSAFIICVLAPDVPASSLHFDQIVDADIREQSLDAALLRLAREAEVSIIFPQQLAASLDAPNVSGPATLHDMLIVLLAATDLEPQLVDGEVIAIVPRRPPDQATITVVTVARPGPWSKPAGGIEEMLVTGTPVTGSRIRRLDPDSNPQIDIIDREHLELSGQQTLAEILRFLPAVAGNSTSTKVTNGGNGTAMVALRGLPVSNTLILINGRRTVTDALAGRSADLNTIPLSMVERVEVLKDGASAVYGSDAIAGVVNVITRRHITGLHLENYFGSSEQGDLETAHINVIYGHEADSWAFDIGASYYDQQPLWSRHRSISRTADDRLRGGIDKRSSATPTARIMLDTGPVILNSPRLDGGDPSDFRPATDEDRFDYRTFTTAVVPSTRTSVFGHAEFDTGESLVFIEGLVTHAEATNTLAPTPLFTGFEAIDLTVSATNAFNPFGQDIGDVRRRVLELPAREQFNESLTLRGVIGIRSSTRMFDWEASITHAETRTDESMHHILIADRVQRALGPAAECDATPGCVALNLFGPVGSITPTMLQSIRTHSDTQGRSRLETASFDATSSLGQLPGGSVEFATGVEYRHEYLRTDPDRLVSSGGTIGGTNFTATEGRRDIWEWYGEVLLPLMSRRLGVESLELGLAGRVSRYSDFGWTSNPKVSLIYRPHTDLTLRASYSEGFRAPTLQQLYIGTQESFAFLNDPCSSPGNIDTMPGCSQPSDPTLVQFLTLTGGNPDLLAETARSYTIGVVWHPTWVKGVRLAVDYYDIRQDNVVDASAQFIVNQNARRGIFADRVERDVNGNITQVHSRQLNIGRRDVSGIDLAVSAELPPTPLGNLKFALNAAHIREFSDRLDPTAPIRNQAGTFTDEASDGNGSLPHWKGNVGLHWTRQQWEANYTLHYIGELKEIVPSSQRKRTIDDWRLHNLQVNYYTSQSMASRVTLGVNNLFDEQPPFSAAAFNDSFDGRTYDLAGRFLYARVTAKF